MQPLAYHVAPRNGAQRVTVLSQQHISQLGLSVLVGGCILAAHEAHTVAIQHCSRCLCPTHSTDLLPIIPHAVI